MYFVCIHISIQSMQVSVCVEYIKIFIMFRERYCLQSDPSNSIFKVPQLCLCSFLFVDVYPDAKNSNQNKQINLSTKEKSREFFFPDKLKHSIPMGSLPYHAGFFFFFFACMYICWLEFYNPYRTTHAEQIEGQRPEKE